MRGGRGGGRHDPDERPASPILLELGHARRGRGRERDRKVVRCERHGRRRACGERGRRRENEQRLRRRRKRVLVCVILRG